MKGLIKRILNESIGGNTFYLIVTKDSRFYLTGGDDWERGEMLMPMDDHLSYDELDKLHHPGTAGASMYKTYERAERSLKSLIKWYNPSEERRQSRGWSDRWTLYINNLNKDFEEAGLTWDSFEVREYYLGLVPVDRNDLNF
jgi:hypothetical protein